MEGSRANLDYLMRPFYALNPRFLGNVGDPTEPEFKYLLASNYNISSTSVKAHFLTKIISQ